MPFVVLATNPRVHAIGAHAGLRPRFLLWMLGSALVAWLFGWAFWRRGLSWYEQKRVVHEGEGPL